MPNTYIEELRKVITTEINRVTGVEVLPIYNNPTAVAHILEAVEVFCKQKVIEARIDEVTMVGKLWSVENSCSANNYSTNAYLTDRLAQLNHNKKGQS